MSPVTRAVWPCYLILAVWCGAMIYLVNTPEQEPECKPVPQLSEILK